MTRQACVRVYNVREHANVCNVTGYNVSNVRFAFVTCAGRCLLSVMSRCRRSLLVYEAISAGAVL